MTDPRMLSDQSAIHWRERYDDLRFAFIRPLLERLENDGLIAIHNDRVEWMSDTTVELRLMLPRPFVQDMVDVVGGAHGAQQAASDEQGRDA